jgi:hypothetical protein
VETGGHGRERGSATVEHVALAFLIAILVAAGVGALAGAPPGESARELGGTIARRIACAPRHPVPCGRNPLALAYGFPVGKLVRYLAPSPEALAEGGLLPVDFRRCRSSSCALPGPEPGLTASNRRVTLFSSVEDRRPAGGPVLVTYWLYRPTVGWSTLAATGGEAELAAAAEIRLNVGADPALVPLETLAGRNHHRFPAGEQPPWRWRVPSRHPG